ncbi:MAG: hypothetical protein AB9844_10580 [Clostridiaceae bacterium]
MEDELVERLRGKPDIESFLAEVSENPSIIGRLIDIIKTEKGSVRFYCEKVIRLTGEKNPELVYPFYDEIASFIDCDNNFIKWGGIITLSNLAAVDDANKFRRISEKYFSLFHSKSMITARNAAENAYKLIEKNPEYEKLITKEMLKVQGNVYYHKGEPSPECKNIMMGAVIDYFDKVFEISGRKKEMLTVAATEIDNTRKKVAQKARAFLKKYS